jgi:hypothetical protein
MASPTLVHTTACRQGAAATVRVSCSYSRYRRGEFVVETFYHLADGTHEEDPRHRLTKGDPDSPVLEALWDLLFEVMMVVKQQRVRSVRLDLDVDGLDPIWCRRLAALACLLARELGAEVAR